MNYKVLESPRVPLAIDKVEIDSKARKMALIGHLVGGEKVRKYFNQFALDGMESELMDLGNVVSEHCISAGNMITDLVQNRQHLPLVVSNLAIQSSLNEDYRSYFLNSAFISARPKYSDQNLQLGLQSHLIGSEWELNQDRHLRLGQLRTDISAAEVLLRNADHVDIDLNVLRYSDNPCHRASTAGLTIEELCMIAKYAGASTQLKAVIISGYNQHQDAQEISARNVALIIWYLVDGFRLRQRELKNTTSERSFTILPDNINGELTFIENQNTGRWWVEVYSDSAEKDVRMACGKGDYEAACHNEISDRLTSILTSV